MKEVILVDKNDKKVGKKDALSAHFGDGLLHRAFTIFIFNKKGEILLQKRSKEKFLWPQYWECSCSSHPEPGENLLTSAKKRLKEELGISCNVKKVGKFYYFANYKKRGSEKEICWLLVGNYQGKISPNKKEVAKIRWISPQELKKEIEKSPQKFAPWLKIAFGFLEKLHSCYRFNS